MPTTDAPSDSASNPEIQVLVEAMQSLRDCGDITVDAFSRVMGDVSARLRKIQGLGELRLRRGFVINMVHGAGSICISPIPQGGADCEPLADGCFSLVDLADAIDRVLGRVPDVADPGAFLSQTIDVLHAFERRYPRC